MTENNPDQTTGDGSAHPAPAGGEPEQQHSQYGQQEPNPPNPPNPWSAESAGSPAQHAEPAAPAAAAPGWPDQHTPYGQHPQQGQQSGAYPVPPQQPQQYPGTGEQVVFGTAAARTQQYGGGTGAYQVPPQQPYQPQHTQQLPVQGRPAMGQQGQQGHRGGGLVAGITVLALIVGGAAGSVGGYLVADSRSSASASPNALDTAPPPVSQSSNAPAGSVEAVAAKLLPSLVELQVRGQGSADEGSGFVISADGLIVTNNHVVAGAAKGGQIVAVFQNGSTANATIVGRDPTSDVAVVRAQGQSGLPPVQLGRSEDLKVGQGVVAFGSPFELSGTVTSGIVSALHRPTTAGGEDASQVTVMDAIQTDAAINPGNSGGPLVNMQGQVIGINSAIYTPRGADQQQQGGSVGIGFAIPIDQARRTADEIVKTGRATQTILGATVQDAPNGGAAITDVTAGGPGAKAGVAKGDVVVQIDDRKIPTADALVATVRGHAPGDKVTLQMQGGRTVSVTLGGQPVPTG